MNTVKTKLTLAWDRHPFPWKVRRMGKTLEGTESVGASFFLQR